MNMRPCLFASHAPGGSIGPRNRGRRVSERDRLRADHLAVVQLRYRVPHGAP